MYYRSANSRSSLDKFYIKHCKRLKLVFNYRIVMQTNRNILELLVETINIKIPSSLLQIFQLQALNLVLPNFFSRSKARTCKTRSLSFICMLPGSCSCHSHYRFIDILLENPAGPKCSKALDRILLRNTRLHPTVLQLLCRTRLYCSCLSHLESRYLVVNNARAYGLMPGGWCVDRQ